MKTLLRAVRKNLISTRPFGETCYSEPIEEIWTLSSDTKTTALCATTGESLSKVRRKKERDWSTRDRRECHDEDEVTRLEDRGCLS